MERAEAEQAVAETRWADLVAWLSNLSDDERLVARTWYRGSLRALARKADGAGWGRESRSVRVGLALALSDTPEEAVKNCGFPNTHVSMTSRSADATLQLLLLQRGGEWAEEFARRANDLPRSIWARGGVHVFALTAPVVFEQNLPVTDLVASGWARLVEIAHYQSRLPEWHPTHLLVADGSGGLTLAWPRDVTLYDTFVNTPRVQEILVRALGLPDRFMDWRDLSGAGWDVEDAVRRSIAAGALEREPFIEALLDALTRSDKATAQQVMARMLRGTDFSGADAASRTALISHLMPSAHGAVTATLLDALLDHGPSEDVVLDVGTVVLMRKEKAQKARLLTHVLAMPAGDVRTQLLTMASADADRALADRATAGLGTEAPDSTDIAEAWGLTWNVPVVERQVAPYSPFPDDAAGFDAARSDSQSWIRLTTDAAWLDLAVRMAHRDREGTAAMIRQAEDAGWYTRSPMLHNIQEWGQRGEVALSYGPDHPVTYRTDDGQTVVHHPYRPAGYVKFLDQLSAECLNRSAVSPELLSTPSTADGTVTLADLLARLDRAGSVGVGPYDLVQALLRLEPTTPADAERLVGARLPVFPGGEPHPDVDERAIDAVRVVRDWIAAGGLPPREIRIVEGVPRDDGVTLPLPRELADLEGLDAICGPINEFMKGSTTSSVVDPELPGAAWLADDHYPVYLGMAPYWTEGCAALTIRHTKAEQPARAQPLNLLSAAPGEVGLGMHYLLALTQSHTHQASRLHSIEATLRLATEGRLDPDLLAEAVDAAYGAGQLSLARIASTWDQLIQAGALSSVWPSMRVVLDQACGADKKPTGLADVLRVAVPVGGLLARNAPRPVLPPSVDALAAQKGSTKAVIEARALVAAVAGAGR